MLSGLSFLLKSSTKRFTPRLLTSGLRFSFANPSPKPAEHAKQQKAKPTQKSTPSPNTQPKQSALEASQPPNVTSPDQKKITHQQAQQMIRKWITQHEVCLFIKGTFDEPWCGYSNYLVVHLKAFGIHPFSVNVLENDFIKQEIKKFSHWQTFPQLYINGVFQGGADVVRQLVEDKTWEALLRKHNLIV